MTNVEILASAYTLLDDASEKELKMSVALEQLSSVLQIMNYEKRFGNVDNIVTKSVVNFTDTTGVVSNTLTNFGHPIYLEFNTEAIEEAPVGMLELYYTSGIQRVAFWEDETGLEFIQLAIPQTGTLKVWYEPDTAISGGQFTNVPHPDSLRWCIATRLALACLPYVHFNDPVKVANRAVMYEGLKTQAKHWEKIYLEAVNKIGTNRPFSRLPFQAGASND